MRPNGGHSCNAPCKKRPVKRLLWQSSIWCTILAVVAGLAVTLLFLLLFSLLMSNINAPDSLVQAMACLALCAGSFTAGFVAARRRRRKGLLVGLCCGVAMYFAVFLIGLLLLQSFAAAGTFAKLVFMILCSCIGGVVGVNCKCRKPRC